MCPMVCSRAQIRGEWAERRHYFFANFWLVCSRALIKGGWGEPRHYFFANFWPYSYRTGGTLRILICISRLSTKAVHFLVFVNGNSKNVTSINTDTDLWTQKRGKCGYMCISLPSTHVSTYFTLLSNSVRLLPQAITSSVVCISPPIVEPRYNEASISVFPI